MARINRREMVKGTLAGGLLLSMQRSGRAAGPNEDVRLAVIGLGGIDIEGSVGGRGRQLLGNISKVPGTKVVAVCDVDEVVLNHGVDLLKKQGHQEVKAHADMRRVFDDPNIDAVAIATPNHWHALATIWACQAGKDVYVEKPFSHNIWEGRQMVAAARKFDRIVQVGTQSRSSENLAEAFKYIHSGEIGKIRRVHALIYRARGGIARVDAPTPVPSTVDYDQWCGPIPIAPVMRKHLHYEWHWFWQTGDGEIGNNGPHTIDVARWLMDQKQPPPRSISIGGRFGVDDQAETANTQIAIFDYQPAPMICEVRNLRRPGGDIGKYRGSSGGVIVDCEGGYYAGDRGGGTVYDQQGKKIKEIQPSKENPEPLHMANFVDAVRDHKMSSLNAEAEVGHVSAACFHMANISYRLGRALPPADIREKTAAQPDLSDAFARCEEHLRSNGIDLTRDQAVLGPWVTWDNDQQQFAGEFAKEANQLSHPTYRKPYEVPRLT